MSAIWLLGLQIGTMPLSFRLPRTGVLDASAANFVALAIRRWLLFITRIVSITCRNI